VLYVDVVHDVVADAEPLLVSIVSPDEAKSNSRSACRPRHDPGTTAESRPSDKSGKPPRPAVRFADPTPPAAAAGRDDVRDAATSTMTVRESANSVSAGGGTQHHRHKQQQQQQQQ